LGELNSTGVDGHRASGDIPSHYSWCAGPRFAYVTLRELMHIQTGIQQHGHSGMTMHNHVYMLPPHLHLKTSPHIHWLSHLTMLEGHPLPPLPNVARLHLPATTPWHRVACPPISSMVRTGHRTPHPPLPPHLCTLLLTVGYALRRGTRAASTLPTTQYRTTAPTAAPSLSFYRRQHSTLRCFRERLFSQFGRGKRIFGRHRAPTRCHFRRFVTLCFLGKRCNAPYGGRGTP